METKLMNGQGAKIETEIYLKPLGAKLYLVSNYKTAERSFKKLPRKSPRCKTFVVNSLMRGIQFTDIRIPKTGASSSEDLATFFNGYPHLLMVRKGGEKLLTNVTVEYQQENPPSTRKYWVFKYVIVAFDRELSENNGN